MGVFVLWLLVKYFLFGVYSVLWRCLCSSVCFVLDGFVLFDGFDWCDDVDVLCDVLFVRKMFECVLCVSRDVIFCVWCVWCVSIVCGGDDDGVDD